MVKLALAGLGVVASLALAPDPNARSATLTARPGSRIAATARTWPQGTDFIWVTIDVQGAPARSEVAWAVHQGNCRAIGPVLGDSTVYPPLVTDFTGETWEIAGVPAPMAAGREYVVVIRGVGEPAGEVAACGDLKEPMD